MHDHDFWSSDEDDDRGNDIGGVVGGLAVVLRKFLEATVAPLEEWHHDSRSYDDFTFEYDLDSVHRGLANLYNRYHERAPLHSDDGSNYTFDETADNEADYERGRRRERRNMLTAQQIAAGESSSRKRSRSTKPARKGDETPEERDARREERRKKKEEREIRKAAEAAALRELTLGKSHKGKNKDKGKEKDSSELSRSSTGEPARAKKPKLTVDEVINGVQRRKQSVASGSRRSVSPKPQVRSKHHASQSSHVVSSLNHVKDSSERRHNQETRHHNHHDHESLEAAAACGRCVRRQKRKDERAALESAEGERSASPQKPEKKPEKKSEKLAQCVTCLEEDIPVKKVAKLSCGHNFCHECLKRLFMLSLTDPAHMPPKCCTSDHIPLKHVDKLLNYETKKQWNTKYLEYNTANRIYCPTADCGEWIPPQNIHKKIGKCSKCKAKVCAICNGKSHGNADCPKDPETLRFLDAARENKYQKCYNCRQYVELSAGCYHMTCTCTAEFCYLCGEKWKSCDCPWFNPQPAQDPDAPPLPAAPGAFDRNGQLAADEELARRLARELNLDNDAVDPAAEFYELPIDPIAVVATATANIRNQLRGIVANAIAEYTTPTIPPPPPPIDTTGREEREVPRSRYLSNSQQAHVERYIRGLNVDPVPPVRTEEPRRTEERRQPRRTQTPRRTDIKPSEMRVNPVLMWAAGRSVPRR